MRPKPTVWLWTTSRGVRTDTGKGRSGGPDNPADNKVLGRSRSGKQGCQNFLPSSRWFSCLQLCLRISLTGIRTNDFWWHIDSGRHIVAEDHCLTGSFLIHLILPGKQNPLSRVGGVYSLKALVSQVLFYRIYESREKKASYELRSVVFIITFFPALVVYLPQT